MRRSQVTRITAAVLGGTFAAMAILAFLMVVNADLGFTHCTATTGFGWTLPLLTGALVTAASWLLLRHHAHAEPDVPTARPCPACGGSMLAAWRLCPHCGSTRPAADPQTDPSGTS